MKQRIAKTITALALCLALCLGMLPVGALAAGAENATIELGAAQLTGGQTSNVYFGNYQQSKVEIGPPDGTEGVDWIKTEPLYEDETEPYYYLKDPIKWRVLSNDEDGSGRLFLLADQNLDIYPYLHEEDLENPDDYNSYSGITWETSSMRHWLNGTDNYSDGGFIDDAFSGGEQGAIAVTHVYNATYDKNGGAPNPTSPGTSGGNDTDDRVFLLSIAEAQNSSYFANDASRAATNTQFAGYGGSIGANGTASGDSYQAYWLRSLCESYKMPTGSSSIPTAALVWDNAENPFDIGTGGIWTKGGNYLNAIIMPGFAVRPAFNLDLNSILFTSAAVGGKADTAVDGDLIAVAEYGGTDWKLTLMDTSRSFSVTETSLTAVPGGAVSVNYSGAKTGGNEYVSAMIVDSGGNVLYYGRIAQGSESGTAAISIPAELPQGSYTLKVFSEQHNGDYKTDYASNFVDISLTVINCTEHVYNNWKTTYNTHTGVCTRCGAEGEPEEHTYDEGGAACNVCGKERTDISDLQYAVLAEGSTLPFNGKEQTVVIPKVTVYLSETDTEPVELTYTLSGQTSETNIGDYKLTINGTGHFTGMIDYFWFIVKAAAPEVAEQTRSHVRTQTASGEVDLGELLPENRGDTGYTVTSSGYTGLENVAVSDDGKLTYTTKVLDQAVTDTITVTAQMQNYQDATITVKVDLHDKTSVEITGVEAATGLTYNGQPHRGYTGAPAAEGCDGPFTVTYSGREGTEYSSTDAPTKAGKYTVTIAVSPDNLSYTGSVALDFEIAKADLSGAEVDLTLPEGGYTYDGGEKTPDVVVEKDGTVLDVSEYSVTYSNTNGGAGNHTNAGTVTVTVTAEAAGNWQGSAAAKFAIQPATLTPSIAGTTTKPYDGKEDAPGLSIALAGVCGDDDVTAAATFAYNSPNVAEAHTITATGITLSGDGAGNYQLSSTTAETGGAITKSTNVAAPDVDKHEGHTINYIAETITVDSGYEVSTAETGGTAIPTGSDISGYLGQTLLIRKAENDNQAASGWAEIHLEARPTAPSLTKTDETLRGQKNGTLNGLKDTMEYRVNGGQWTSGPADLTNLAGNTTIEVRVKATNTAPHGDASAYTIGAGKAITVTFDHGTQDAAGMPEQITDLSYGTKLTQPDAPTAENTDFAFVGWYKDADGHTAWDFNTDTLTAESVTLYAKWKQVYFSVTVKVKDSEDAAYDKATVTLMRGSETIDRKEGGTSGSYSFSKHVEAGMYNVVVTYASDGDTQTKTALIEVSGDSTATVTLPPAGVNSRLTVSNDDNTPAVMVGGLDEEAAKIMTDNSTASKVTVSMSVEGQQESAVDKNIVEAIQKAVNSDPVSGPAASTPIVEYLDVSLTRQIDDEIESLTATTNVIELVVPFDFDGRSDIVVVRYHGSAAEQLKEDTDGNKADGTYRLAQESGYIHIYTQKFSTYAIAYTLTKGYTITLDANDGNVSPDEVTTGTDGKLDMSKLPTPTRSGYTFAGWYTAAEGGTQVTENTLFTKDTTLYAHWTRNGGSGGVATYPVTVTAAQGGSVQASPTQAAQGTTVTLTVTPEQGYQLSTLTATDAKGNQVTLTEKGNGQYTLTMPASKVTVEASFAKTDGPCDGGADCPSHHFTDVDPAQWYHSAVDYMVTQGLMNGTSPTKFAPNETTTRAMIVTILYRLAGEAAVDGGTPFTDVKSDQWYTDAITWAATTGVVNGVTPTTFEPNTAITREQLAAMLWRYAGSPSSEHSLDAFTDAGQISGYAKSALAWANETHVVNGKGNGRLDPAGNATRVEAAQMLKNFLEAQ